jgi:outer membrane immunogenic protein
LKPSAFALAAATFFVAVPAHAQFSGPRVEARLAYDSVEAAVETGDPFATDDSESAISYGGEAGYDLQLGPVVVGAYAGLEGSNLRTCQEVFGGDEGCIGQGRNLYVGGRLGLPVASRFLVYGKAGYSNGSIDFTYEGDLIGEGFELNEDFGGYHVGIGGEFAVTDNFYGRLEYVHTDYGELDFEGDTAGDFSRGQLMVGAGLRF